MGLDTWIGRLAENRRALALVGLITAFAGVGLVLNPAHLSALELLGFPLLLVGCALFVWIVWPKTRAILPEQTLGQKFLHWITWKGRLIRLFPVAGVALLAGDLAYNFRVSASPALLTEDLFVLLTATSFLTYGLVPVQYSRERDFVLLFFIVSDAILVVPLLLIRALAGTSNVSVDVYSWIALAPELSAILSGIGVSNSTHPVAGYAGPGLTFTPVHMSQTVTIVITASCSGIYSFGIFAAAYVAFLLTDYSRPFRKLWLVLGLGFVASYAANLLRMVVIVLVGYYTDSGQTDLQNLLLAHSYAGWIIFLAWIALFWGVLFKFLPSEKTPLETERAVLLEAIPPHVGSWCRICGDALSFDIPAARCLCGAIFHRKCLAPDVRCPRCKEEVAGGTAEFTGGP